MKGWRQGNVPGRGTGCTACAGLASNGVMMRRVAALAAVWAGGAGWAQTHAVKNPDSVVRAVAVYEWTGDEGKATASRVVPVSVFINGQLEDGGIYLARPVPFALDVGTIFEVEKSGEKQGTLELAYARHYVVNSGPLYDDGWLAYGAFKAAAKSPVLAAKKSGPLPQVVASGGNRPHFSSGAKADADKADATDASAGKTPVDRSTAAGGGTTVSAQDDPDRVVMRKRDGADSDSDSAKDDPERPTLKRRTTPAQTKQQQKKKESASVTGPTVSLNDDPDRPVLHRGAASNQLEEDALPPLKGVPADMKQAVAVSDAKDREEHDFKRGWESDAERAEVTATMEELARAKLAAYDVAAAPAAAPAAVPAVPATAKTPTHTGAARAGVRRKPGVVAPAAPAVALTGEKLSGYTLSYGGAATYVYAAASPGVGGATRYVTVVAQREPLGALKVAMTSVTDSQHLDRTPWLRLVDAVDAEASNRASLLFELRGADARQFGLYRVIGAKAEQTFVTAVPE